MVENYYLWVEISANRKIITDKKTFSRVLEKAVSNGIKSIILGAKDTTGYGIYQSEIVPHYSLLDDIFNRNKDYLSNLIEEIHNYNLKAYAAIDVFAEGKRNKKNNYSPAHVNPGWQTEVYGLDNSGDPSIKKITEAYGIKTVGSIDDFGDIFVNPVREDVREYELRIIEEITNNYDLDGIVLDRVRFVGLSSDFSHYTQDKFEEFIGDKVYNWPEDIYRINYDVENQKLNIEYGNLFGKWITFRAYIIKTFIKEVKKIITECDKDIEFLDYAGSWYPIYYQVGANWASKRYIPEEYPWVDREYAETGYAEEVDKLLLGYYYPDVTVEEAQKNNKPDFWYSVEGSGIISNKVVKSTVPVVGSLYVAQYKDNPLKFVQALKKCFEVSDGCMIFDLTYLEEYNWWKYCKLV